MYQSVHGVIVSVADNIRLEPWEGIRAYQGYAEIQEDTPLGFLADGDRTVYLTVERVTEIRNPQARAALSKAGICADAGDLQSWHQWQLKARRLEKDART